MLAVGINGKNEGLTHKQWICVKIKSKIVPESAIKTKTSQYKKKRVEVE